MIHVIGQQELVPFDKTEPGDLVNFEYDGERAIGIVLERNEDREPLVGVLSSNFGLPRLLRENARTLCATYGVGWAIEPWEVLASVPGLVDVGRRAGLLALSSQGWLMNFASSGIDGLGRFNWEWWDLNTFKPVGAGLNRALLYDAWKMWAPAEERSRAGAEPMFDYRSKPTAEK